MESISACKNKKSNAPFDKIIVNVILNDPQICRELEEYCNKNYQDTMKFMPLYYSGIKSGDIVKKIIENRNCILLLGTDIPGIDCVNIAELLKNEGLTRNLVIMSWYLSSFQQKLLSEMNIGYFFSLPIDAEIIMRRLYDCGRDIAQREINRGMPVFAAKGIVVKDDESSYEGNYTGDLKDRVTRILHDIGIPANLCGHEYLREAIVMVAGGGEIYGKVTKIIYPEIGRRYSKSPASVEKAIRTALETAWLRGRIDLLNDIFGFTVSVHKGKPTNSEFIALLADYVLSCK